MKTTKKEGNVYTCEDCGRSAAAERHHSDIDARREIEKCEQRHQLTKQARVGGRVEVSISQGRGHFRKYMATIIRTDINNNKILVEITGENPKGVLMNFFDRDAVGTRHWVEREDIIKGLSTRRLLRGNGEAN